ncbi:hypothetical protein V2J09_015073 [Rumex salicifolius]
MENAVLITHAKGINHLVNPVVKVVILLLLLITPVAVGDDATVVDPVQLEKFVDELPNVPKLYGYGVIHGRPVPASLHIGMFYKKWKTATIPGPTIEAVQGVDTYVTWQNHLPKEHILPWDPTIPVALPTTGVPTVPHLHGGLIEPSSDGHAKSWFTAGFRERGPTWENETYHYLNFQQPGNLWYHDHALGLTRVNLLAGLVGAYVIRQPDVELPLRLPSGDEFDRTLVIFDRDFLTNGSIYMNPIGNNPSIHPEWQPEYFGGVIVVNGKAWPKMTVRRRKYRFRIINTSNARFMRFNLSNNLDFIHVGSDSAYLSKPVKTRNFLLAPSEIGDVIIDFSTSPSDSAILFNDAPFPFPSGDPVNESNGKVMKFIIVPLRGYAVDESRVPSKLLKYPSPDLSSVGQRRYVALYEYTSSIDEPTHLLINALTLDDPVTEIPKVGTSELWYIINLTEDNHPVHIHLGLFRVLDQTELIGLEEFKSCMSTSNDAVACKIEDHARGSHVPVPAHESGWKNVFKMKPGFVTTLYVRFSYIHTDQTYRFDATAQPGYVYHCHILDHEDNVMMRPIKLIN